MRALVVENDDRVARALTRTLRAAGYEVFRAADIRTAGERIAEREFTVALVDLMLDDGDGVEVIRILRDHPGTAVIAVTALGAEVERVRGLRAGADDYLVKPFGVGELLARIEAVTRRLRAVRAVPAARGVIAVGQLELDLDRREARLRQAPLTLSRKEFQILLLLAHSMGNVVTREHLLDQVWQSSYAGGSRTLHTHMASLRTKLGESVTISTVRGVGYRLEAPGDRVPPEPADPGF